MHKGVKLLSGFDDAEITELNARQVKAFKDSQAYEKAQAALERREKDLGLKLLIRKRKQRNGVFEKQRALEAGSVAAKLSIPRKIYPATSIRNPQLLNNIRIRKKRKYVRKFERLVARIKNSRKVADR